MTITKLAWRDLVPDSESYQEIFAQPHATNEKDTLLSDTQPRLQFALEQLIQPRASSSFMLTKAPEEQEYLTLLSDAVRVLQTDAGQLTGGHYDVSGHTIHYRAAQDVQDNFATLAQVVSADWVEAEQLFGCLRQYKGDITLQPGLVHQANGGVLIISLRTLLAQPLLWMRLKAIVTRERFDWVAFDESRPLPVSVPSMPLKLKVILVGERESLADFQEMEPELAEQAIYSEFEDNLQIADAKAMALWCQWVTHIASRDNLPAPAPDVWPVLIREAVRYTGEQDTLPLCPLWIARQFKEAAPLCEGETCDAEALSLMLARREWREGFLAERMQDEILQEQILIETEGERVGQINALSVIEFPGHPRAFGEPSRISCVVHIGDGEFNDIERKAELGGNIHAKGMMIMQAFLMSELQLEQQIPFSASLTFEQSYSEVDGDSASMAELCALISALANVPVNQNIAITGSVDQFGRAQPVGGLNEKIEGFFAICEQRELSGKQGVIIPAANVRHLSLKSRLLQAVKEEKFTIWAVDDVTDALPLLLNLVWDGEGQTTLMQTIQERIAQATQQEGRHRFPWPLRWLNYFIPN
ncbi:Lon protease family protein [Salmonella enterica subsp. arizonae str. CFSAN000560]|uniref:endopeptidase La n=1 Tax=Salmonella enterica I TaxID=59201 RepID=A0A7T8FEN3_SALET|nr:Lon protease [Salmonella enterica subsp. arizonae serovar 62:z36:- str. RKS2983]EAO5935427.1 Lon protease family protein [Salmonella enterica subsp. houtenae serovar 48:g,z51:-]EAO5999891.1 Lon protease family protein [Salmonella enterica subsp. arizonae serovar 62:z36:-]EBD3736833.1 Lon protease family protein [Salmonella enterica]ECG1411612.1 Lon protease family protein [Salmonella enterica subsp. arizonae str. CFSAN000560]ECG8550026.1 Lon protease family protein [Salmonella enterica subs